MSDITRPARWEWPRRLAGEAAQWREHWRVLPWLRWKWEYWPTPRPLRRPPWERRKAGPCEAEGCNSPAAPSHVA